MKHVNLLLLASSLMLSCPALAQEYKQVWSDEFDNLEDKNWNFEEGTRDQGFGNWELERYHKANASVGMAPDGSKSLIITAKPDMTSARLYSKDKVSFKYGKLEARVMIPKTANGLWPAFWMLGQSGTWPSCGEIDILEMGHKDGIGKSLQERYYNGACHWGVYTNGNYPNYSRFNTAESSLQDGKFHTFTMEWTPEAIKMYLDNAATPYYSMDISKKSTTSDPGNYFNKEFYVLINLAIGGTFTGITNNPADVTALQNGDQKMYVDYVRLYQKEGQECYNINGKKVDNIKGDSGQTDTTTDLGIYGSKSLDANGKSTFDFDNSHDYVLVAVSDGVKNAMGDKIKADYRPGVSSNQMDIWEGTFSANTSTGNNSFGNAEAYTDLSVGTAGWSGLGYESPAGLDYSMLDDSYYLHFAMKNDDVAAHNTYAIWVGGAKFALGNGAFPDGNNSYPKIGDFKRDGEWYSFDIPVKALKGLNSAALDGCGKARFNIFSLLAGGVTGTRVMLDNIFFYKNETKNPDQKPDESDDTPLGEYGYKALNDAGESNFDFSKASDFVVIGASQGVIDQMGDKVKKDYSVDNTTQHLYVWVNTYTATPVTGVNSFGLSEQYTTYTVNNVGWSGLGYAGVKDLSMLDDNYYLHFSVKGDDALAHASHEFGVGNARFTIGNTSMENTMILGDFPRDGKWYSFDIPVSMLKSMANPLFPDADGGATAYKGNAFCALSGGTQGTKLTFDNVFFFKKAGGDDAPDVDATLGKFGSKALDADHNSTFDIAKGSDYVLVSTGATFAGKVADAGKLKANYNVDNTNYNFNLWEGTMTASTPSGVNSFGFDEDYSCVKVTGSAGWSGAGYAPAASTDMSMVDDTYCLHFSMKSTQDAPFAIVVGEKAHFTIGSAPFADGNNLYATIGNIYRNGEWYSFDIPMSEIKKYGTPKFLKNGAYTGNFLSVLAGGTAGVEVNIDGVFFYKPNKDATNVKAVETDGADAKVIGIFDLGGRKVENMNAKGVYIVKTTQGVRKVMKR